MLPLFSDIENIASQLASVGLLNIRQEYPNKPDHVINLADEVQTPRTLHPVFYGSFDWHSCVHMHWMLARLLRLVPGLLQRAGIEAAFDEHFTPEQVAQEIAYLGQASRSSFERTYGWAWLLKLQTELLQLRQCNEKAAAWSEALQPLAEIFACRYLEFLPKAQFPIRAGTHANSAFGLLFALEYAEVTSNAALRAMIAEKAQSWFGNDRSYPAGYEPGGDDFLSGGLIEAALMLRLNSAEHFAVWWRAFSPAPDDLQNWLAPVPVSDRADPKIVHLDGLNLSRAWCWKMLGEKLKGVAHEAAEQAFQAHLAASLPHSVSGDYAGTHWLASFALLALSEK